MMSDLKATIEQVGQPYYDKPVYAMERASVIEKSVRAAFGRAGPRPILLRHERITLRWLKPDGKGGLVPR